MTPATVFAPRRKLSQPLLQFRRGDAPISDKAAARQSRPRNAGDAPERTGESRRVRRGGRKRGCHPGNPFPPRPCRSAAAAAAAAEAERQEFSCLFFGRPPFFGVLTCSAKMAARWPGFRCAGRGSRGRVETVSIDTVSAAPCRAGAGGRFRASCMDQLRRPPAQPRCARSGYTFREINTPPPPGLYLSLWLGGVFGRRATRRR